MSAGPDTAKPTIASLTYTQILQTVLLPHLQVSGTATLRSRSGLHESSEAGQTMM